MNIYFSIDDYADIALYTTINSIIKNCSNINIIKFNILVNKKKDKYISTIKKNFENINFEVKEFNRNTYEEKYDFLLYFLSNKKKNYDIHSNLMNYARIYLPMIFPDSKKSLYLDTDIIVQHDILELFNNELNENNQCAAVLKRPQNIHFKYPNAIPELNFKKKDNYIGFNTGVYLFDSDIWRNKQYTKKCENILKLQLIKNIMSDGTQPLINLLFYDKTINIDHRWNTAGAGWNSGITEESIQNAYIIHWSGRQKPWLSIGLWKKYWNKYYKNII